LIATLRLLSRLAMTNGILLSARKIAILCKNLRRGNTNTQVCVLPGASLDFCTTTAQRICAISSSTDKNSNRSFAKLSAW